MEVRRNLFNYRRTPEENPKNEENQRKPEKTRENQKKRNPPPLLVDLGARSAQRGAERGVFLFLFRAFSERPGLVAWPKKVSICKSARATARTKEVTSKSTSKI